MYISKNIDRNVILNLAEGDGRGKICIESSQMWRKLNQPINGLRELMILLSHYITGIMGV